MENASKALIMAGSILIALIIISLGVMIFKNYSNSVKNNTSLDKQTIASFNRRIDPYIGDNKSASQVNTLRDIAISINNNAKVEGGSMQYVNMTIDGSPVTSYDTSSNIVTIYNVKAETGKFYKVEPTYNPDTGLINTITVTTPPTSKP